MASTMQLSNSANEEEWNKFYQVSGIEHQEEEDEMLYHLLKNRVVGTTTTCMIQMSKQSSD
ncbi:hypothetical protein SAMD00019534_096950 [Acytostelium subglobosum LB1]|uniref:hypothetical protein n=1 Tax=Acytostelium subglobosum LB1 TaxID=1410327 RepID=UPI000644A575|nr:hypothetical protein SAMD00019534_096950 [Acytostelium subglobosum LB1]GAM26520.1 hypothetical protein SAMD00019534_096950 [Acytostelium subglobosum LB1]|eukprot:XP_012750616.1 hypothetical protein SAMD00019534_096950 [Acytostelium subglobosum LB1]